jgi:small-conductance mechanosensitive channel
MLLETWTDVLTRAFQDLWIGIIAYVPNLVVAIIIFTIGWLIGSALSRVIAQVIRSIKVDNALRHAGVEDVVRRAGFDLDSGAFLGALVKWFVIIVFLVASLNVLGLSQVNAFLVNVVLGYLPQVIVAVLILLVAAVLAEVVEGIVRGAARAADVRSASFAGSVAKWAIWLFAILAALNHLQVAPVFMQTLFTGIVVAASIAIGLAFGLGGQQAAAQAIEKLKRDFSHHS